MTGRIPPSFIDELLHRVNIVDIIDSRVPLSSAGSGEYKARCPFHEEKTPSFTVSQSKQFYYCFGCGAHGTAIGFLMEHAHMGFLEAVENLAAQMGMQVPREGGQAPAPVNLGLLEILDKAGHWFRQQLRSDAGAEAVGYLKERGLDGKTAADFGIGYAPDGWDHLLKALGSSDERRKLLLQAGLITRNEAGRHYDRFRKRVIFPVDDERGRVVGFGGRILGEGEPKYLNSPETPVFHKGSKLYGLHKARGAVKSAQCCLVVEGYMDVISLARHGIGNVVATLGTATTDRHLGRLFSLTDHIVFCFDADRAGDQAAWKALQTCLPLAADGRQASFLFLPEGHDPDTLVQERGADGMRQLIREALPLPEFLLRKLREEVDMKRLDGPGRLAALAKPLVQAMPRGILRQLVSGRLAALTGLSPTAMARNLGIEQDGGGARARGSGPVQRPLSPLSPMARIISMLLQQPALSSEIPAGADWRTLDGLPGVELLAELAATLRANPGLTTAALVERYRDTPHFAHLEKLAAREHVLHGETATEFRALVEKLLHDWPREREIEALLRKNRSGGLDGAEKERLKALLRREEAPAEADRPV